jgi:hypothetical protein
MMQQFTMPGTMMRHVLVMGAANKLALLVPKVSTIVVRAISLVICRVALRRHHRLICH